MLIIELQEKTITPVTFLDQEVLLWSNWRILIIWLLHDKSVIQISLDKFQFRENLENTWFRYFFLIVNSKSLYFLNWENYIMYTNSLNPSFSSSSTKREKFMFWG